MPTITSAGSGNWNSTTPNAPWPSGTIPTSADTVIHSSGHTITIPDGYAAACGPYTQNGTLVMGGGNSGSLTHHGAVTLGNAAIGINAGFNWNLNSQPVTSDAYVKGNRQITFNVVSGKPIIINGAGSGANGYFKTSAGFSDSLWITTSGHTDGQTGLVLWQSVGDSTNAAIRLNPSANTATQTFLGHTFDADCGLVDFGSAPPTGGGWNFKDCRFLQTNAKVQASGYKSPLWLRAGTGTITGTRNVWRCVFVEPPHLTGRSSSYRDCYFAKIFSVANNAEMWTEMDGCLLRQDYETGGGFDINGPVTNCFNLASSGKAATDTGTSSGSNSTTELNDTSKNWTTNRFALGTGTHWYVEIFAGTGAGQRRGIKTNTDKKIVPSYRWDTTPDATSQYRIVEDIENWHGFGPVSGLVSGTLNITDCAAQYDGTDTQGDWLLHFDNTTLESRIERCWIGNNGMGDNSGTLITLFGAQSNVVIRHCTAFMGAQSAVSLSEATDGAAGQLDVLKDNIFWCDPSRVAASASNTSDTTKYLANGGCHGPYGAVNTFRQTNITAGTKDLIVDGQNDGNVLYGALAGTNGNGWQYWYTTTPNSAGWWNTDPEFVDNTRSFWSWAVSRGCTDVTITDQVAYALAEITADPTLVTSSLMPYIAAGFAPTNSLLENAGTDGATPGAFAGSFTPPPTPSGDDNNMTLASTTNTALTASAWTKIADATDTVHVQAQQNSIYLRAAASSPSETDGFILQPVNFANRQEDTGGTPSVTYTLSAGINLYARGVFGAAIVSVMKD